MSSTLIATAPSVPSGTRPGPTRGRRAAVAVAGFVACVLPTVFTVSIVGQLLTGTESEHRFHQLTGQGLLLTALWLGGLVPMVLAGWHGVAPSVASVWQVVVVSAAGVVAGLAAPSHGGLALAIVATVTSAILYAVLPTRPSLHVRLRDVSVIGVVVTVALATVLATFIGDQLDLQNSSADEHAEMAHYFDMAWVSLIAVLLAAVASVVPAARRRLLVATAAIAYLGLVRWLVTPDVAWSVSAMVTGGVGFALALLRPTDLPGRLT